MGSPPLLIQGAVGVADHGAEVWEDDDSRAGAGAGLVISPGLNDPRPPVQAHVESGCCILHQSGL